MKKDSNRGIIVTGGSFTAGAVAVGKGAAATVPSKTLSEQAPQESTKPRVEAGEATGSSKGGFDVFLSHNTSNKAAVRELKRELSARGVTAWLDEDELRPGLSWQQLLEKGVRDSSSIAVLIGRDGLGPWENEEMQAALSIAVREKRPVIPVLLVGAPTVPELPIFLGSRTWVDLREGLSGVGMPNLVWGITGHKPER
jgi:TIR domain